MTTTMMYPHPPLALSSPDTISTTTTTSSSCWDLGNTSRSLPLRTLALMPRRARTRARREASLASLAATPAGHAALLRLAAAVQAAFEPIAGTARSRCGGVADFLSTLT